jgi:hypothetical protein
MLGTQFSGRVNSGILIKRHQFTVPSQPATTLSACKKALFLLGYRVVEDAGWSLKARSANQATTLEVSISYISSSSRTQILIRALRSAANGDRSDVGRDLSSLQDSLSRDLRA